MQGTTTEMAVLNRQRAVPPNVRANVLEKISKVDTNVRTHDIFVSHVNILTECVTKQEKNVRTK